MEGIITAMSLHREMFVLLVEFDVAGVYAERQDYVGMDRSDAGRSTPVCRTASVHVQPSIGTATYSWTDCGVCSFDGATDGSSARYRLDDPEASSSGFLAERLSVSVVCANGDGTCSAVCVTNFTVVKVDVEIDGVPEEEEETQGAIVAYMPDGEGGLLTEKGKANLVEVKITCEPADLPQGEMVDIVSPVGFLYERVDGEYRPAQTSYRAREIGGRSFFLHGHAVSSAMCDRAIEASHAASGARDVAKFTVGEYKFTVYVDQPVAGSNTPVQPPAIVGHAFWQFACRPSAIISDELSAVVNVTAGFYPETRLNPLSGDFLDAHPAKFVCPDNEHLGSVDIVRNRFLSKNSFTSGVRHSIVLKGACSNGSKTYNVMGHNCVHAVLEIAQAAGVVLPATCGLVWISGDSTFSFINAGQFGEDLRQLPETE